MGVEGANKFKELSFGDHICLLYKNKDEYRHVATNYILEGIYNKEKVVCLLHEYSKDVLIKNLKNKEIDLNEAIKSKQLVIKSVNDIYYKDSSFNYRDILDYLENKKRSIKKEIIEKEEFTGLRVLSDMIFNIYEEDDITRLIDYELQNNRCNLDKEINLCVYNKESFPSFILEEVIQSHNVLINGKDIVKPNPYYVDYEQQLKCHKIRSDIRKQLNLNTGHNVNSIICNSVRESRDAIILKYILGSSEDGVWEWHIDSNEVYISNNFFDILGYKNDQVSLKIDNLIELIHPKDIHGFRNQIKKCYENEIEHIDYEIRVKSNQEEWAWFRIRGTVLQRDEICGNAVHVVGIYVDIRERKRTKLVNELDEKNLLEESKVDYISNIFHELRTPLNVILGSLQLQEFYIKSDETSEYISKYSKINNRMKQNSYRLLRLLNNVIDIAKIDSGFYNINLENYDIKMLIENIAASIEDYVKNSGLKIKFKSNTDKSVIACDPEKMEKILLNILSNAIKFTEPGGEIVVNLNVDKSIVKISIKDTGIGIPEDKLENIFDRFKQVNSLKHRANEGSGIGLFLVKEWVNAHGGEVSVKSKENDGTEFIIKLPNKTVISETHGKNEIAVAGESNIERLNIEFSDIYS